MAIFGNRKTSDYFNLSEYDYIQPTTEAIDQILTESAKDSYKIRAAMYISDVLMERSILIESADPQVLLEGFGKDIYTKLKNMLITMWNKIKSWYEAIKKYFLRIFTSGKEFVKKFDKELRAKNVKGYKYKSFKYTMDKGNSAVSDISGKLDSVELEYTNGLGKSEGSGTVSNHKEKLDSKSDYKKEYDTEEDKEKIFKRGNEKKNRNGQKGSNYIRNRWSITEETYFISIFFFYNFEKIAFIHNFYSSCSDTGSKKYQSPYPEYWLCNQRNYQNG